MATGTQLVMRRWRVIGGAQKISRARTAYGGVTIASAIANSRERRRITAGLAR